MTSTRPDLKCCTGCASPFNTARKIRQRDVHTFVATTGDMAGRKGSVPIALCGVCVFHLRAGVSIYNLPAFAKHAYVLESLVLDPSTAVVVVNGRHGRSGSFLTWGGTPS
jgi:hypothetical protein